MNALLLLIIFIALYTPRRTRSFAVSFLPWMLFGASYDMMRFYPNYMVNDIDVRGIYELEKRLFGIVFSGHEPVETLRALLPGTCQAVTASGAMVPSEWFALHHNALADLMAGLFYLSWVPVPLAFAFYLYFSGQKQWALRFSWGFLLVNWLGFVGYYIHPAAPPWYAMMYGFEPVIHTPGNVAGLGRWDELMGLGVFHGLYGQNANVFAAVPSLHAAYLLVTTIYAWMSHQRLWLTTLFAVLALGIWWTAVYSGHHYIIDVLLGILTTLVGVALWEGVGRRFVFARQHKG